MGRASAECSARFNFQDEWHLVLPPSSWQVKGKSCMGQPPLVGHRFKIKWLYQTLTNSCTAGQANSKVLSCIKQEQREYESESSPVREITEVNICKDEAVPTASCSLH